MSTDPCLDAALAYIRPSLLQRMWRWYKRVTGYEPRPKDGLRIQSTALPPEKRCHCGLCDPRRLP
jgi:hypothetical protein